MGFVGIYLAYGCFRTLTRKPIKRVVADIRVGARLGVELEVQVSSPGSSVRPHG